MGTSPAAAGSQVFPGYQPQDEVKKSRTNVAGYVDVESDITEKLLVHAAGRVENYSDFGGNCQRPGGGALQHSRRAGLAGLDGQRLPGALAAAALFHQHQHPVYERRAQPGAHREQRQPHCAQQLSGGTGQRGFGVGSLKQEKSTNYSLGLTARVAKTVTLTVDAYQIDIGDRIVLSSQFTRTNPLGDHHSGRQPVSRVQFFANAVNTRTQGIDIVANERLPLGDKAACS